ncbi:DUF6879 family protein [Streptomyces sp. T028]|uniref:DUF6879 family protein n=1 Tax=Streptomyces sp. T028 TaxID=3394379 RepID=UPI003A84735B
MSLSDVIGLDTTASAVYRAMLNNPTADVDDLSRMLQLTEGEVRDALDALADSALLEPSRANPGTFRVVDPRVALERALQQEEEELTRKQQKLEASRAKAAQVLAEFERPGRVESGDVYRSVRITGLDAIQSEMEVLARDLRSDLRSVVPGGAQSAAALAAARPLDTDVLARGVQMRTLYQDSARNDTATIDYARWLTEHEGQVRTAPLLPPRLLVFDSRIAMIPLKPSDTRAGALRTEDPAVVKNLVAMFEQAWEMAVPLGADRTSDANSLTPTEREILKLLASGITDEAASRRLGVSMRTVRRQMAALMERLDASSRFEAGINAARRGWL